MDGDDIAEPDWLETGVQVLDTMPDVGICSFGFQFFGAKTSLVRFPEHHEDSKAQMLFGCTVIVPVFRRAVMADNHLRYSTEAFPAEDYMMWSNVYPLTQIYNVQRTLFHYRTHPTQISTSRREAQIVKSNEVRLKMLHWLNPNFTDEEKRFFLDIFVPCKIESKEDIAKLKCFAQLIISRNTNGNYSNEALRHKFKLHIGYGVLEYVERTYFPRSYTPIAFLRLLSSGLFSILPARNCRKILVKSLLLKKK